MAKSYPRTPLERSGQVNWRDVNNGGNVEYPPKPVPRQYPNGERDDRGSRFIGEPECTILITKRRGFGSTGDSASDKMSIHGVNLLKKSLTKDRFQRYQVNIWPKYL